MENNETITSESLSNPTASSEAIAKEDNAKTLSELMRSTSLTDDKKCVPRDHFAWIAHLYTNSSKYIIAKIQNESELINNDWHFIPFDINEELQAEFGGNNCAMDFFCIDDKKTKKRFTNTIRKYFPNQIVDWQPFDNKTYKEFLNS